MQGLKPIIDKIVIPHPLVGNYVRRHGRIMAEEVLSYFYWFYLTSPDASTAGESLYVWMDELIDTIEELTNRREDPNITSETISMVEDLFMTVQYNNWIQGVDWDIYHNVTAQVYDLNSVLLLCHR
jgi:hypothetical protein